MSDSLAERSVIVFSLVIILLVAIAPWLTGGMEPLAMAITTLALLLGSILVWLQKGVLGVGDRWLSIWYGGLALWTALSLIWTVNRYQSVLWLGYFLLAGVAFILANRLRLVPQFRRYFLDGYILSCVLMVGFGAWLFLTESFPRLTSSFYWPNPAAAYLLPAIILLFERASGAWRYRVAGVVVIAGFLLTDSRGAVLALVVGVAVFVLMQRPKRSYWINLLFIVLAAYLLSIGVGQARTHIFHQSQALAPGVRLAQLAESTSGSVSLADRLNYVKSSFEIWEAHPILGTGAGTFATMHPLNQIRVISASTSAHNIYAQTLSELGLPGALLLVLLVLRLLIVAFKTSRGQDESLALAAGLLALFVHFGLDIDNQYLALIILAAVYAGMLYMPTDRPARWTWGWAAIAAAIAAVAIGLLQSQDWVNQAQANQDAAQYQYAATEFSAAHSQLIYNPDTITQEGINWYTLGLLNHSNADLTLAVSLAKRAQHQDPDDGQHYFLAARALRALKELPAAKTEYLDAIRLDPFFDHPDYYADWASLEFQEHNPALAKQIATSAILKYPLVVRQNRGLDPTFSTNVASLYLERAYAEGVLGESTAAAADLKMVLQVKQGH